ncbi:hypothetical protein H072_6816 [Dactylellina haptotyla CBS 200.50]|uniref:Major facilitator superfamily (MFS) profile domain-containing protein n=1 Tax=Dactylellina haptotyla (strain CBS 200.50) TaxID=1284197 RepID=S8AE93_DACHA|nr:hypothetical protein H072_6816 [Dactylellina haptotyla CBS 200.50]
MADIKATIEIDEERTSIKQQTVIENDNAEEHSLTFSYVLRNHPSLIFFSFYWAISAFGWGFDSQINGAMISVPAFRRDFGYVENGQAILPAKWQTAFNCITTVGGFFGGFVCSYISDRFGRKIGLLFGIAFTTGGIFGEIFATTNVAFLMSKIILGFGLAGFLTIGPMATSEITPVVLRGISTAGINLGIALGQLVSNGVIKGFGDRTDHWAYRGPFAIQFAFVVFLLACFPFVPESPWYLVRQGRIEEATKSFERLWGGKIDASAKVAAIQAVVAEEEKTGEKISLLDCFRGTNLIRTGISMGGFACQHFTGIIFVLGYSTYFFQLAGLDTSRSFDLGVGVTACGFTGNLLSWFVLNSFGRRRIFNYGMVTLTALLLFIGIMDVVPTGAAKWVQAACTVIYAFVYFLTIGAVAFVLLGEVSSPSMRAHTAALATATQSILGLIMNFAIPYMVNPDEGNLKGKVGFIFGGLAAIATVGSFWYVPELKGRTFAEIDQMFQMRVPPRKMGEYQF